MSLASAATKPGLLRAQKLKMISNITTRLPDELLERIFMWNMSLQRKDKYMRYTRVAFVCSSWRRIALHCSSLWSFIRPEQIDTEGLSNILLPRSKNAPLHVKASLKRDLSWKPAFLGVLKEFHRIRELSFAFSEFEFPHSSLGEIISRLTYPAPALEKFVLNAEFFNGNRHLPLNLFDNHAPKLKTLKLRCCSIRPDWSFLVGLTALKLTTCDLSIEQSITLLKATPNLTKLCLVDVCRSDSTQPHPDRVFLPHLEELEIQDNEVVKLLACITHPSTTLILVASCSVYSPDFLYTLGQQVAMCISYVHQLGLIRRRRFYFLDILGWRSQNDCLPSVRAVVGKVRTLHGLRSLLKALPLTRLETLRVDVKLPAGFWVEMFGSLTSLESIHGEGDSLQLLRALLCGISHSELARCVLMHDGGSIGDLPSGQLELDVDKGDVEMMTEHALLEIDDEEEVLRWESDEPEFREEEGTPEDEGALENLRAETSFSDTLAMLRLRRTPAPLFFKTLKSLTLTSWHSRSHPLDTTLLAALLHARGARGSILGSLYVTNSTHYSRNADKDVERMWEIVEYGDWDVTDGLAIPEFKIEGEGDSEN
ncbi:hypothetical protein H0H92_016152 [Tricholoma furcatifolium]|nr:hypothetical protein H0H92_016152 [Tricholoma furcatifolium]